LHLTIPWRVVIAGRPNAGKSSLLNALLGFQRSIISPQPGTTRDVVTAVTAFDGWPVELRDTAGLRESRDAIEAAGVASARREIEEADLLLLVIPANESTTEHFDFDLPRRMLIVRSKADLVEAASVQPDEVAVSVITGVGLDMLVMQIMGLLMPLHPSAGAAVPITWSQVAVLHQACALLRRDETALAIESLRRVSMRAT
jgi:tRNA modification GTPase